MSKYDIYGKITINDGKSIIDREISITKDYPEMVLSKLVIGRNDIVSVPFGTVTICKYILMKTDKTCTINLISGSNSVGLDVEDIFMLVDTELDSIEIGAGNDGANVDILIAGE